MRSIIILTGVAQYFCKKSYISSRIVCNFIETPRRGVSITQFTQFSSVAGFVLPYYASLACLPARGVLNWLHDPLPK